MEQNHFSENSTDTSPKSLKDLNRDFSRLYAYVSVYVYVYVDSFCLVTVLFQCIEWVDTGSTLYWKQHMWENTWSRNMYNPTTPIPKFSGKKNF